MGNIICFYCQKEIKSKNDLIVALYFFFVKPYHSSCYSKELQSVQAMFVNYPLNGFTGTSMATVGPFIGLIIVLSLRSWNGWSFTESIPIWALFFIPTFLRIYTYYKFEKSFK